MALIKARTNAAVTETRGGAFEAALDLYLNEAFTLHDSAGRRVALKWSGSLASNDLVVVTYDAEPSSVSGQLWLQNEILMETNPDQVNTVNITENGATDTLVFRDGDAPRRWRTAADR